MFLNHLDIHVPDVAATRDFLRDCFNLIEVETRGADGLAILRDDAGFELVISRPIAKFGTADTLSAGANTFHIGFIQPSREAVDRLYDEVVRRGAEVRAGGPRAIRGGWLFYCYAPGRVLVEVGWRPPA